MDNEGIPITAHAYRDDERWKLRLELPRWLARELEAGGQRFRINGSTWPGGTSRAHEPVLMTMAQDSGQANADADAALGKTIRGLPEGVQHILVGPKGHVYWSEPQPHHEYVGWRELTPETIREYNERED